MCVCGGTIEVGVAILIGRWLRRYWPWSGITLRIARRQA